MLRHLGCVALKESFPRLFSIVRNKEVKVAEMWKEMGVGTLIFEDIFMIGGKNCLES